MDLTARGLGRVEYRPTFEAMRAFAAARDAQTPDELWICEHPPVFTQGLAGKPEHVLLPGDIPIVATDRGGQVTYHGPGQVVAYPMVDLRRRGYFVKEYVFRIEEAVIRTLLHFGITGYRVRGAPGIYVRIDDPGAHAQLQLDASQLGAQAGLAKIAALGIKVTRHCTYHGVALNVAMDLEPFSRINPCGYAGLKTADLSTMGISTTWEEAATVLSHRLAAYLAP